MSADFIPSHRSSWSEEEKEKYNATLPACCIDGSAAFLKVGEKDPAFCFLDAVKRGLSVKIGKFSTNCDALIGALYGSYFELDRGIDPLSDE